MNVEELKASSNPFSLFKTILIIIFILIFVQSWNDTEMSISSLIDGWKYMLEYISGNEEIEGSGFFSSKFK